MDKLIRIFIFLSTFGLHAQNSQSDFSIKEPVDLANTTKISLWSTHYYIHRFQSGGSISLVLSDEKKQTSLRIPAIFARPH